MVDFEEFMKKYSREGLYFEAKSASEGIPADFWETYSSFANTFGGTIVLGLSDNTSHIPYVTGVQNPEATLKTLWDNLNNPRFTNCNLLMNKDVTIEEIEGKNVIVVNVPAADRHRRPIYIRNNLNGGTFKRNHEGDYHCTMDEIKQMLRDSEDMSQDSRVFEDLSIECLDRNTVSKFLSELTSRSPAHPWARMPLEEFLEASGAARPLDTVLHPTAAGLLMFGKVSCIRRYFGNYFLDYRETLGDERWTYRYHSNSGEWSGNIYDFISEVMNRISVKIGYSFSMNGYANAGTSERFLCVREAIMNAVLHADYLLSRAVTIILSPNRITISNPGTMRVRLSDARRGGFSDPRNGTLIAFAMAVGWVERIGSGIYEIDRAVREGKVSFADIRENTDPSMVEAVLGLSEKTSDSRAAEILEFLKCNPEATRAEIAELTGLSISTIANILTRLKEENRIARIGNRRSGHWEVL